MEISNHDYDKFNEWYKDNIPSFKCDVCGSDSSENPLSMPSAIFTLTSLDRQKSFPIIVLSCISCGGMRLLNVVHLERMGCPIFNFLPKKNNILRFFDYFKRKK